ncbi:serine/threonine protein kinase [Paenibacillus alvei]|uniref:serine/threonine protein kinase n=1 Tax=Paenibacillus alvei TaxID=44250 RepID=UPI00028873E2|nr:serine/threonine-protein kinase [Paenibacillus alvei]EJW15694.1 putative serine/threonine-protein kinase [Paenibacillus alvei DSM 29]MCY9543787.1 serine/threonine protein kinase [Paenibacillus alvei]MCY9707484.1 serine/threonine protein kinase [Paenibacillus alvei]MCY9734114.1 serine/threonine protein kinase [Paenibacillus alvei]MCY9756291.1 serine/threonine protein kinase [Paenibacillus alvei]
MAQSITAHLQAGYLLYDRYRIVRLLGTGGMSVVYLANDERLIGKQWAIKESRPAAQDVRQLVHEASILTTLRHPHLPLIVDFYPPDTSGRAYLVMEYIEGHTIADRLRIKPLSFEESIRIVLPVCEALSYLHQQNPPVVFRDVKPSNIMLAKDGQVKLIDFGIARNVNPLSEQDTVKLGTVGFAAPEQYRGQQTDARTDLYGVGALVSHMLTGGAWKGERPLTASMLAKDVPENMFGILTRLLAKLPEERYQSADELIEDLRNLFTGHSNTYGAGLDERSSWHQANAGTVIAFWGAASGLGTTHSALMCAAVLAKKSRSTLYIDANYKEDSVIPSLAYAYEGEEELYLASDDLFKLFGIDCMEWKFGTSPLPSLLGIYEYIVLDLGCDDQGERMDEFMRAHIPVLVGSLAPWREKDYIKLVREFELRRFNRWVLGVLQSDFSIKTRTRKWRGAKATSSIPIQSDPFEYTEGTKRWVEQLIGPIQQGGLVSRLRRWISRNKAERGDVRS